MSSSSRGSNDDAKRTRRTLPEEQQQQQQQQRRRMSSPLAKAAATAVASIQESRSAEAAKQLLCGGVAGSVAKTVTAPFSRLTILFQVHSLVTTKEHRPKFAMSIRDGISKIVERGGILSLWRGNMTSVLHRFPYSAINFFVYENTLDLLSTATSTSSTSSSSPSSPGSGRPPPRQAERNLTERQLVRRMSRIVLDVGEDDDDEDADEHDDSDEYGHASDDEERESTTPAAGKRKTSSGRQEDSPAHHKFLAGAWAGTIACLACYPLDLVRTRLTTELEGREHYRGIVDAFRKIRATEGFRGFYSGVGPTLLVAVPNLAISYTVYGTLKEYTLDDELFYNLRRIDADSGESRLGFVLTVMCGAASGILATLTTFPMDTIRRRMQIQNLHLPVEERLSSTKQFYNLVTKEGLASVYRGLTPELLKVIPMVGTMFYVYEWTKDTLNVRHDRR